MSRWMMVVGTLLVSLPVGAQSTRIQVAATPELAIAATSESGDLRFASAAWATRLPSGEIVVADVGDASLRILSADGRSHRALGGRGAGPGEYRIPLWVGRCRADSLVVWDATGRITSYGDPRSTAATPVTRDIADAASSMSAACSSSGQVALLRGMQPRRDVPPALSGENPNGGQYNVTEMTATLIAVDPDGSARSVRAGLAQGQWVMGRLSPQGGMGGVPRPLAPSASFAFAGDVLVIADATAGDVVGLGADGREAFRFKAGVAARRPATGEYERASAIAVALVPAPMRDAALSFLSNIPAPEQLPPFGRVLADPEGLIWLVVSPDGAAETAFRVYRRGGQLVAEPRVAGAFVPFEVGAAQLLGKRENADGEDELVVFRITRTR